MSTETDRLYQLLPGVIRLSDAAHAAPLRDLLRVIGEQVDLLEDDIRRMYENMFIETCEPWAIPYLGDLVGHQPLDGPVGTLAGRNPFYAPRREVANTIALRRRKGTLALLGDLSLATAGWPLQAHEPGGQVVAIELYRLHAYPITRGRPFELAGPGRRYTFSILGNDTQLFTRPDPDVPFTPEQRHDLPAPLSRDDLRNKKSLKQLYCTGGSLCIYEDGHLVPAERLVVTNLDNWSIDAPDLADWRSRNPQGEDWVAVDPESGRFMVYERAPHATFAVSYFYGFVADLGGGEYARPAGDVDLAPSLFRHGHLADEGKLLAKRLLNDNAPFVAFVRERLDAHVLEQATRPGGSGALRAELNRVVLHVPLAAGPTASLPLDAEARRLLDEEPRGARMVRLNRLLLEAAFPDEIARSYAVYQVSPGSGESRAAARRDPRSENEQGEDPNLGSHALAAQIDAFRKDPRPPRYASIELVDSWLYEDRARINVAAGQTLALRAIDGCRPAIGHPDDRRDRRLVITCEPGSRVVLDGLLVVGRGVEIRGRPAEVLIRHCTLVPGWSLEANCEPRHASRPSLIVSDIQLGRTSAEPYLAGPPPRLRVRIEHSILGPILVQRDEVGGDPMEIAVTDSVIDAIGTDQYAISGPAAQQEPRRGPRYAPAILTVLRSTVNGMVRTHAIERADNSIFTRQVVVARRQIGCMRFCYVLPNPNTPRRYSCQPDLAMEAAGEQTPGPAAQGVAPVFVEPALRYGSPNYCRLDDTGSPRCPDEILGGADDEAEMGVFHSLYQPQRLANLELRLAEYLPVGWQLKVQYAT